MVFDFLRRRTWDLASVAAPWGERPSIYGYIAERLQRGTPSLSGEEDHLPDEERVAGSSRMRWVAGGLDGAFGHHAGGGGQDAVARSVFRALRRLTEKATGDRARELYTLLTEQHSALGYLDPLLEKITASSGLRADRVLAVARWLATEAPDREPVKVAIALIGALSREDDRELFLTLGKHEEFTLYCAVALTNSQADAEPLLFELGQAVTGWGRIHVVERLAETRDPRVKDWLLREGCRNAVMNEYTALICARAGGLVAALRAPAPDDALLDGAGTILSALTGGPAAGIEEYADGPEAVELYLGHLRRRELELRDLNVAASIGRIVDGQRDDPKAWERWRVPAAAIEVQLSSIKDRPDWPAKIEAGLASPDPSVFSEAAEAAKLFGIDTWDVYFDRLQRGEDVWFFVMQTDDPLRIDRVIRLAEERLPLDAIATGPADELGLGPGFEAHGALDFVLQDLGRFAGRGWALIRTGLRSPVVRNRHMAVRALAAWQRSEWPGEADLLLRQSAKAEPDGELRGAMENLIAGRPSR